MNQHKRVEKLMLFVEVAEQLNFSLAAKNLGISRSYLSEQVKRLEAELEAPLVIRTTRSVRLTPEGFKAYQQGLEIRNSVLNLERYLSQESKEISGLLRLTAPKMFSESILLDLCQQFRKQHPNIRFEINSSYTTFNLSQSEIDLAFRATRTPPENMVAVHLTDYHHWLVASPEYIRQKGVPEDIDALKAHQCLTTLHQRHWPLKGGNIYVDGWMATNENRALRQLALAGEGIVRIASYFVQQDVRQGKLLQVLEQETDENKNAIYMIYPQVIYPSARLKAFTAFVKEHFDNPLSYQRPNDEE